MSRIWHSLLAVVVLASLIIEIALLLGYGQDVNTGQTGYHPDLTTRFVNFFGYITIQSNLLVLFTAISLVLDPQRDGRIWRVLRLASLLGITVTGVVYVTLLSDIEHHQGVSAWANAGLHYFAPLWTILGWLLFGPRPRIDWRTIGLTFLWPVAWLAYTLIRGAFTGSYPYPFMDVTALGYEAVLANIAVILSLAFVLSVVFMATDRHLPRRGTT